MYVNRTSKNNPEQALVWIFLTDSFTPKWRQNTVGGAECARAEFKFRYLNNGYNYD